MIVPIIWTSLLLMLLALSLPQKQSLSGRREPRIKSTWCFVLFNVSLITFVAAIAAKVMGL